MAGVTRRIELQIFMATKLKINFTGHLIGVKKRHKFC